MAPDTPEVVTLVERVIRRDREAFADLFQRYYSRVCGYLISRGVDFDDVEDIATSVFIKAWYALERYEQRGVPFGQWLFRIGEHETVSFIRRNQRHQAQSIEEKMIDPLAEPAPEPDEMAVLLDELTPMQADVLTMRYYDGMTSAEVAEVMGIADGSVRALQFRGLAHLRKRLMAA